TVAQTFDAAGVDIDREDESGPNLVREARGPQRHIESGTTLLAIGTGSLQSVYATVLQPLQLMLEIGCRQRQTCIKLHGCPVDLCGQSPAPALELVGTLTIDIDAVQNCDRHSDDDREQDGSPEEPAKKSTLQRYSSTAGSRRL